MIFRTFTWKLLGASIFLLWANSGWATERFTIAVLDSPKGHSHSEKVLKVLNQALLPECKTCRVLLLPVYDQKGNLRQDLLEKAVTKVLSMKIPIAQVGFNLKSTPKTKPLETALIRLMNKGIVVIGPAGENSENIHLPLKLSQTVLGKAKGAVIVGELSENGYLSPRSNYGPEISVNLKPPKGLEGSSFCVPLHTAAVAKALLTK